VSGIFGKVLEVKGKPPAKKKKKDNKSPKKDSNSKGS